VKRASAPSKSPCSIEGDDAEVRQRAGSPRLVTEPTPHANALLEQRSRRLDVTERAFDGSEAVEGPRHAPLLPLLAEDRETPLDELCRPLGLAALVEQHAERIHGPGAQLLGRILGSRQQVGESGAPLQCVAVRVPEPAERTAQAQCRLVVFVRR
jgi:hypothetical protein